MRLFATEISGLSTQEDDKSKKMYSRKTLEHIYNDIGDYFLTELPL